MAERRSLIDGDIVSMAPYYVNKFEMLSDEDRVQRYLDFKSAQPVQFIKPVVCAMRFIGMETQCSATRDADDFLVDFAPTYETLNDAERLERYLLTSCTRSPSFVKPRARGMKLLNCEVGDKEFKVLDADDKLDDFKPTLCPHTEFVLDRVVLREADSSADKT
eukprot:GILK01010398.1.p1 GENE.GILK01010398.1~~GILK01010398.1.p1  ORF type:complete len:163 (-),score=27.25 GILK01010398.1:213-701(-)